MAEAVALGERGRLTAAPNPWVGSVVVGADGQIVGRGFHHRAGEPHAEVHALAEAGARARGATAYVTLEPCAHHGRTPPCADALVDAGVRPGGGRRPRPRRAGRRPGHRQSCGPPGSPSRSASAPRPPPAPWPPISTTAAPAALLPAEDGGVARRPHGRRRRHVAVDHRAGGPGRRPPAPGRVGGGGGRGGHGPGRPAVAHVPEPRVRGRPDPLPAPPGAPRRRRPRPGHRAPLRPRAGADPGAHDGGRRRRRRDGRGRTPARTSRRCPRRAVSTSAPPSTCWAGGGSSRRWWRAAPPLHGALLRAGLADRLVVYTGGVVLGSEGLPLFAGPGPGTLADASRWRLAGVRSLGVDARLDWEPVEPGDLGGSPASPAEPVSS